MDAQIQRITSDQLIDKIIMTRVDALVYVSSNFSGAGQIVSRSLTELSNLYHGRISFFSVDYEADSALTVTYRIADIPTILFFKRGRLVDKSAGLIHRSILFQKIQQLVTTLN